ncbi:hypothetical protein DYB37_004154 [Aphanomyces astaci]|uniref:Telomerase reverse transcriptase n=1 Tax=Aphanomyces astaci TaxID=112090 RepID=A0A3R7F082_APHAT|nr:hypothetical protein DYB35_004656 [Aphanomyces astaci]RHZ20496.1 hypothetical protein DYB37_004154 [Aphanomyces astaci]
MVDQVGSSYTRLSAEFVRSTIGFEPWMEGDNNIQTHLQQTFVARRHTTTDVAATRYCREVSMTQSDVVESAINTLLQRKRYGKDTSTNLLTLGYGMASPGANNHFLANDLSCYYPNTLVAMLKSNEWVQLHLHIGDDVMKHILLNHNVFVLMANTTDCYIQLAGDNVRFAKTSTGPVESSVSIRRVMYARGLSSHPPSVQLKRSILSPLNPSKEAARRVVATILRLNNSKRLDKRGQNLVPIVQDMMTRFKACDVGGSVRRMCALPGACVAILKMCRLHHQTARVTVDMELEDDGFASQDESTSSHRKKRPNLASENASPAKRRKRQSNQETIADLLQFHTPKEQVSRTLGTLDLAQDHLTRVPAAVPPTTPFPISTIRFEPKSHGVRPIMNLSKKPVGGGVSVNRTLRLAHHVHVDGVVYDYIQRRDLIKLLQSHLLSNYVTMESELFLQTQGIPQGSVLSSLLCSIYYADFEKNVLMPRIPMQGGQDLLLRYTDDFLFLTTNKAHAETFQAIMHRGSKRYGCRVNPRKTQTNLLVRHQLLRWCGLVIDPTTLAVYSNYAKYTALPRSLKNTLYLDTSRPVSAWFFKRLLALVQFRCHHIFFSPKFPVACQTNMYHIIAVVAVKYVYMMLGLPRPTMHWNMAFFHRGLVMLWQKLYGQIRKHCPNALTWSTV